MSGFAKEHGWWEMMSKTWFCHTPTCHNKPCGKCTQCLQVMEGRMNWRIPFDRRIVLYFYTRYTLPLKIFVIKKIKKPDSHKLKNK